MSTAPSQPDSYKWKGKIACQYVYNNVRLDTSQMKTSVNSYVYTLFLKGSAVIKFDKSIFTSNPGEFLIFPPNIPPVVLTASDDYEAICLIVSSAFVRENPMVHNVFQTVVFSLDNNSQPIIKLSPLAQQYIHNTLKLIMEHMNHCHLYTYEALQSLFGVMIADAMQAIDDKGDENKTNNHNYNLFLEFCNILRENFREHHDITFYADRLNISPRYLSMVTKQVTQHTVANFINQHLVLEACWLLKTTDDSIRQISETLHFADQASFSKFFKRIKGVTPLHYRNVQEPYT